MGLCLFVHIIHNENLSQQATQGQELWGGGRHPRMLLWVLRLSQSTSDRCPTSGLSAFCLVNPARCQLSLESLMSQHPPLFINSTLSYARETQCTSQTCASSHLSSPSPLSSTEWVCLPQPHGTASAFGLYLASSPSGLSQAMTADIQRALHAQQSTGHGSFS